jgi:hypothetical protein
VGVPAPARWDDRSVVTSDRAAGLIVVLVIGAVIGPVWATHGLMGAFWALFPSPLSGSSTGPSRISCRGRAERAITEQQVFGRQALAPSVPGGEVVD